MLLGAGTGVAAGGGSHKAKWFTVDETWVLDTVDEAFDGTDPDASRAELDAAIPRR